jgi:hypothetical protein
VRLRNPPRYRVAISLFHFRTQQRFQIAQMVLLLAKRFFRQFRKLHAHRFQLELLGILADRRLLHRSRCRCAH